MSDPTAAPSRLPRRSPGEVGVDPAAIPAWVEAIAPYDPHSMMIVRQGQVIAEGWWEPYGPELHQLLYSLSKSFAATAVGFTVAEGLVDLDDRVTDHLPAEYAELVVPELAELTLRHVLAMASGHDHELLAPGVDPIRSLLGTVPEHAPGGFFAYSQPNTYTAAVIAQRLHGRSLIEILTPRLFEPLGIEGAFWQQAPEGVDIGFSGLHLRTEDIACFGQFVLDGGVWRGERLLPESWFAEASRKQVETSSTENPDAKPDWSRGYGFQFWLSRHGFRGDGAYGQFCLVIPEHDLVVVTTAATEDMQGLIDTVWDHLIPALGPVPDVGARTETGDAGRATMVTGLSLPVPELAPIEQTVTLDLDSEVDGLSRLELGPGVVVVDGTELPLAPDRWQAGTWPGTRTAVRTRGGMRPDGTAWAALVMINTPHRLLLEQTAESRATLRWHTTPLGQPHPAALSAGISPRF